MRDNSVQVGSHKIISESGCMDHVFSMMGISDYEALTGQFALDGENRYAVDSPVESKPKVDF